MTIAPQATSLLPKMMRRGALSLPLRFDADLVKSTGANTVLNALNSNALRVRKKKPSLIKNQVKLSSALLFQIVQMQLVILRAVLLASMASILMKIENVSHVVILLSTVPRVARLPPAQAAVMILWLLVNKAPASVMHLSKKA